MVAKGSAGRTSGREGDDRQVEGVPGGEVEALGAGGEDGGVVLGDQGGGGEVDQGLGLGLFVQARPGGGVGGGAGLVEQALGRGAGGGRAGQERVGAGVGGDPADERQRRLARRGRCQLELDPDRGQVLDQEGGQAAGLGPWGDGQGDRGGGWLGLGEQGAGLGRVVGAGRAGRRGAAPVAVRGGGGDQGGRRGAGQAGGEAVAVDGQGDGLAPPGVAAQF